jgi:hypothetical protein
VTRCLRPGSPATSTCFPIRTPHWTRAGRATAPCCSSRSTRSASCGIVGGIVDAEVGRDGEGVIIEWTRDSAFRFFPLVGHDDFGLVLHPFDLATNKVLALAGRLEPRDWVDVILSGELLQPLGYLAWAACGKDPGFSPGAILEHAARASRYSADELRGLAFSSEPPDPADLSRRWHEAFAAAKAIIALLPAAEVGTCVLTDGDDLFRGSIDELQIALKNRALAFHRGRIGGAYPRVVAR